MSSSDEKGKFQFAGLRFLYDMELVDDPQLINNMKLNVFSVSNSIKDVEFLSSYMHKKMLVYVELSWFGKKFFEKKITAEVMDRVQQLLPGFKFRIVTDRKILEMALDRVKTALKGETDEKVTNGSSNSDGSGSGSSSA